MEPEMSYFNHFAHNIYSQNGEDGIIAEVLKRIQKEVALSGWVCEFGAWDGKHLSNTFSLVEKGSQAIFIESDFKRYTELKNTATKFPGIIAINKQVARFADDENSLNNILQFTGIPKDFDVLSIDIDSYDLDIFESLTNFSPKIVIIEINSSVLPGIIWRHGKSTPGNTFSATLNVGIQKGYTLICHTGNLIFVRNDLLGLMNIEQRFIDFPELLFLYESQWIKETYDPFNSHKSLIMLFRSLTKAIFRKFFRYSKVHP
jgi:hypothetical protein